MQAVKDHDKFKLRFLYLFSRHGFRAPMKYLTDGPQRDNGSDIPGSLTKKGKIQTFNLGKILRQRYDTFLGEKYISDNVYARSTDMDRTLMSCQCIFAGMFPPTEEEMFVPYLKWQPIPIHTKPLHQDEFTIKPITGLQMPPFGIHKDPEIQKNYEVIKKSQNDNKLPLPKEIQTRIEDMIELYESIVIHLSINNDGIHVAASNIFKEVLENMENLFETEETSTKTKTYVYSLHDFHIIAMIYALTTRGMMCPTSACLMMEVYQDKDNQSDFYVQLFFLNDHNKEPIKLQIPNQVEEFCSFANFKLKVEDYTKIKTNMSHN